MESTLGVTNLDLNESNFHRGPNKQETYLLQIRNESNTIQT